MQLMLECYSHVGNADLFRILSHDYYDATITCIVRVYGIIVQAAICRGSSNYVIVVVSASESIRKRWFRRHVRGEARDVASLINILKCDGNLIELVFLVFFEHLQLVIHSIYEFLFLSIKNAPVVICALVLLSVNFV